MSSSKKNVKKELENIYKIFQRDCEIDSVGRVLGSGAFGEVREIKYKNKNYAGKLSKKSNEEKCEEELYANELRGQNIIKINKVITKKIGVDYYDLIIMEKAALRDLGKLNDFYHKHNLLKLIYQPFDEMSGDLLLRFYSRQIISALETLDRNYLVHYDIKPENLLITGNLAIKLSDFSLLTKVKNEEISIPGGTRGYLSPEYYKGRSVTPEEARKQDYFALGSTLFILKFGKQMLKYRKSENKKSNAYKVIDLLSKAIADIQSNKTTDKDFVNFIISLIEYKPKDRPSFEQIYRNKWLNKDVKRLDNICNVFENDEEKLMMEFQKNDFLIKKEKELGIYSDEEEKHFDDSLNIQKILEKEEFNQEKPYRFRFKKKAKVNLH